MRARKLAGALLPIATYLAASGFWACARESAWNEQELTTDAQFRDVFFLDAERGWLVGGGAAIEGGIIGSTVDGGETWSFQTGQVPTGAASSAHRHQAVHFFDGDRGLLAGDRGMVLRTVDGGENWHRLLYTSRHFFDLSFVDDRYGWVVGDGQLFRTTDGGDVWFPSFAEDFDGPFTARAIQFLDREIGWAAGVGGAIYRTSDGGSSWTEVVAPRSGEPRLTALSFVDPQRGWIVGEEGTILQTADGGRHWLPQPSGTPASLTGVHFIDLSTGWAVGFDRSDSTSTILHTVDGGATWAVQSIVEGQMLFTLEVASRGDAWAAGERVRPYPQTLLRHRPELAER